MFEDILQKLGRVEDGMRDGCASVSRNFTARVLRTILSERKHFITSTLE